MTRLHTSEDLPRLSVMPRRADFLYVAKGRRAAAKGLVVQYQPASADAGTSPSITIGFTASKKVGNAVARNRAKRRLRELARAMLPVHGKPGAAYVLIARGETVVRPFDRLSADLRWALAKVHGDGTVRS